MRIRVSASVEGDATAQPAFTAENTQVRIGIETDDTSRVVKIWVDAPVPDYHNYLPSITVNQDRPHEISMPVPPQAEDLLNLLQYLESLGSFWFGIRRIHWAESELSWIPESPEEEGQVHVHAFSSKLEYPGRPISLDAGTLARLLTKKQQLQYLVIPMSFYREGVNEYRSHRYVSAFYNFYFVIEDLYGAGKTKNRQVLGAFLKSPQFMEAVKDAHKLLSEARMDSQRAELLEFFRMLSCPFTPGGVADFLVKIRGDLHHFSQRSRRPKGHPLNQRSFRSVAYLAMAVCLNIIPKLANGDPLRTGSQA